MPRFRCNGVLLLILVFALSGGAVSAGDGKAPTPDDVARWILEGADAEQARAAALLGAADAAYLRTVFAALRARAGGEPKQGPGAGPGTAPPSPALPAGERVTLVNLETRFVLLPAAKLASLLGAEAPTEEGAVHFLEGGRMASLAHAIEHDAEVELVTAPRVMVQDAQACNVSVLDELTYVRDHEVLATRADGTTVTKPVVAKLRHGLILDMRPHAALDRTSIAVELTLTHSRLHRPVRAIETQVGGRTLRVQVPEVDVHTRTVAAHVPDQGHVVFGFGRATGPDGRHLVGVLTASLLEMDAKALRDAVGEDIGLAPDVLAPDNFEPPPQGEPGKDR